MLERIEILNPKDQTWHGCGRDEEVGLVMERLGLDPARAMKYDIVTFYFTPAGMAQVGNDLIHYLCGTAISDRFGNLYQRDAVDFRLLAIPEHPPEDTIAYEDRLQIAIDNPILGPMQKTIASGPLGYC
jgi:hypothetical protein